MDPEGLADELLRLASQTEAVIQVAPKARDLPPALTAGITDAPLGQPELVFSPAGRILAASCRSNVRWEVSPFAGEKRPEQQRQVSRPGG